MYLNLLNQGWKLHDIDQMDIQYFMELRAHEIKKQQPSNEIVYIDQLGIF